MFDHLLKQSISESEVITQAVVHIARVVSTEPIMPPWLETLHRVLAQPEHIVGLIIRLGTGKSSHFW
jgi:hypothetical protein